METDPERRAIEVAAAEVDWSADASSFGYDTTGELEPLDHIVGQPRAVRALEFGLGVRHPGYNIYVAGASGMGKKELLRSALAARVDRETTPSDWVYVNTFEEANRPLAIFLEPGQGIRLKDDLAELVDRLLEELPRDFQDEELGREKEQIGNRFNIERESKLSGRTYDKGIFILEGYLRHKYAGEHPLSLSAGMAMEQSYGRIDGDSASVAELIALLSNLAGIPLRQDIAITGSVNQRGEIQAVGGVNEKIEGFFDVCQEAGLTGAQGVAIPRSNLRHTILRPEVVGAVREGEFHIWTVEHIDEALELLCERPAGDAEQEGSIHHAVAQRLRKLAGILKAKGPGGERTVEHVESVPESPADPRPPAPGTD